MKPYQHGLIAERRYGGRWQDWVKVPNWLDQTKMGYASVQHRVFLHNDFGCQLAEMFFGPELESTGSSGETVRVPTRNLAGDHLIEDLGAEVALSDWLKEMDDAPMQKVRDRMLRRRSRYQVELEADPVATLVDLHGGTPETYYPLLNLFDMPQVYSNHDPKALWIMHSTFGPFVAEQILGPIWELPSGKKISIRGVAEDLVQARTGYMASIAQVASAVTMRRWMAGANVGKALAARKAAERSYN